MTHHIVQLDALLKVVRDGDEQGWPAAFDRLWAEHTARMDMLTTSIQETGIRMPILIGSDGRVWDGHHRLASAHRLGFALVPVTFSGEEEDDFRTTSPNIHPQTEGEAP